MRKCPSVCPTPLASLVSVNMAEALANPKGAFNFNLPACAPHEILILHTFYVQPLHSLDLLLSLWEFQQIEPTDELAQPP